MIASGVPRSVKIFSVFSIIVSVFVFVNFCLLPDGGQPFKHTGILFYDFNNETGFKTPVIPNLVHYVIFGQEELNFITFLSIVSVLKVQIPNEIWIHSDKEELKGRYWDIIFELSKLLEVPVSIKSFTKPDFVYGQPLSSIYHASDVARLIILQKTGGIYLDCDTVVLKSLKKYLHYEMVLGWPDNDYIGTQILIAHKDSRLLKGWLSGYKFYKPRTWYYNAGIFPTELLQHSPNLAHRVPKLFGVQYLLDELHGFKPFPDWKEYYSIHLLSRHPPTPPDLNELSILQLNSTFSDIAQWILYELKPSFQLFSKPHWIPH